MYGNAITSPVTCNLSMGKTALKKIIIDIPANRITRPHRPSGCGKVHLSADPEPDERPDPQGEDHGSLTYRGQEVYPRPGRDRPAQARIGMVFQRPTLPHVHL